MIQVTMVDYNSQVGKRHKMKINKQTRFVKDRIRELEKMASEKGLDIVGMCNLIKMQPSTYYHWRSGRYSPNLLTWGKLYEAVVRYNQ